MKVVLLRLVGTIIINKPSLSNHHRRAWRSNENNNSTTMDEKPQILINNISITMDFKLKQVKIIYKIDR